jgi:metal-dependent amidase/aminoacylase/carboxypeptidase family protein
MPQLSIDPVVLASMIVVRLQAIVAREVAPGEFAVLTVGQVSAGTRSNIIPGTLATDIPANHSPRFSPVIEPTLQTGMAAIVLAALVWLT